MQKEIVRENARQSSFKDFGECLRHLSIRIVESLITGFFLLDQLRLKLLEPFFLFFPVPERWSSPDTEAMLLSDKVSDRLIELVRPMSGLDNCFPSFHVSLTVLVVAACFMFRVPMRMSAAALGATIVLSTFVLGVHWLPDMLAGLGLGIASMLLAWRMTRAGRLAFLWEDDQPVSEDAPTVAYEPPVPQAA